MTSSDTRRRLTAPWSGVPTTEPRGACLSNCLAKLSTIPTVADPLITSVAEVVVLKEERIYVRVHRSFVDRLLALSDGDGDERLFSAEGRPEAHIHQQLLTWVGTHQHVDSPYYLRSFRERVTFYSLQIVLANPYAPELPVFADIDIDLGGARTDLVGLFAHLWELIGPGSKRPTDHLALAKHFASDPVLSAYLRPSDPEPPLAA